MTSASPAGDQPQAPHILAGAVVGVLAGAVAIGAAQLAAGLTVPQSSPVLAVGQAAIDLTPPPVKDFAISAFGANDKTVLLGAPCGARPPLRRWSGCWRHAGCASGKRGLRCSPSSAWRPPWSRPNSTPEYIVPTLVGAAAGAFALARLARAAVRLSPPPGRARPADQAGWGGSRAVDPTVVPADPPVSPEALTPPDLPATPDALDPPGEPAGETPAYPFTYLPNPDDQGPSRWPGRRRFLLHAVG